MKKTLTTALIVLFTLTVKAQITGYNHFQSYGNLQEWNHKEGNNFIVFAANRYYKEKVIFQFDLDKLSYTYVNDSLSKSLKYYVLNSDSGYAVDPAYGGKAFYTHDNWKTIIENTTSAPKMAGVKKTSTGFVGYEQLNNTVEMYHSKDLIYWTKTITVWKSTRVPLFITEMQGQLTVFNEDKTFYISKDGGQTFTTRLNTPGNPNSFLELVLMQDTATILARGGTNDWYFTKNSGKTWTKSTYKNGLKLFYAASLDSLYATSPSPTNQDSLYLSTDTGKTWQSIAKIPAVLNSKRIQKCGDYFVETGSITYSKSLTEGWLSLPTKIRGGLCISMKGNYGIIGGDKGNYSYTQNGGKTFENGLIVNAYDLMACKVINDTLMLFSDRQSNTYRSRDGGVTWQKAYGNSINTYGKKFTYSSDLSIIIQMRAGQNLISRNHGINWSPFGSLAGIFDGSITPSGKFYIALGADVLEMNTANGSSTKIKTFTEPNVQAVGIEMLDEDNGYVLAINTTDKTTVVFRTKDGWKNYTKTGTINSVLTIMPHPLAPSMNLVMNLGLNIIAPDTLYINRFNITDEEQSSNVIYKSFNGGASWTSDSIVPSKQTGSVDKLQAMHFYSGTKFISIWDDGRIFLNKELSGNSPVSIEKDAVFSGNAIKIFPNPVSSVLNIDSKVAIAAVSIFDMTGKLMLTEQNTQIDVSNLKSGIYFIRVRTENNTQTARFIKQ